MEQRSPLVVEPVFVPDENILQASLCNPSTVSGQFSGIDLQAKLRGVLHSLFYKAVNMIP